MTTAPPPNYADLNNEVTDIENTITPAQKALVQSEVAKQFRAGSTTEALMDEIRELSRTTLGIDADFYKVKMALNKVDNSGFNFPRKLEPEWDNLRRKWQTLLWDSRETATRMAVRLETFQDKLERADGFLTISPGDDPLVGMIEAKELLLDFASRNPVLTNLQKEGQDHSDLFNDLASELNIFKTTFDDFTKAEQARIEQQIVNLKQRINSLTVEIRKCDDAIARLSRALGLTIFGTVVGAGISLFAFGILGPLVAIKVLIVGTLIAIGQKQALANYQRQAEALRAELRQREAELKGLEDKLALLKQLEALLEAQ
ncbi:hypothetical protein FRC11_001426, partial [Ceratobasidium sp. 423]